MKCPFCGKEMESGFVASRSGAMLVWRIKRKRIRISHYPSRKKGEFALGYNPFKESAAQGTLCRSCNKIVLDLNQTPEWPWDL